LKITRIRSPNWPGLRYLAALALFAAATSVLAQGARAPGRMVLADRIVAIVNSEVITQHELNERMERAVQELRARGTPLPAASELQRQVLERMVTDRVQLQYAKETGLRIDDLTVDNAIGRIADNNKMALSDFRKLLERDGVAFDRFREEVRNEITITRLREREVDNKISVAESEIENYIANQRQDANVASEFHFLHILVRVPEQAGPDQLERQRARAQEVVQKLHSGGDFAQLAATYSDAPDALKGGDMGWRNRDRLPELFAGALAKLKPGGVSEVLRSPAGFHILKLIDRRGAGGPEMVEQDHLRHILVRTNEVVSEEDARRKLLGLRERIENGADFGELAKQYSDDPSGSRGGDLGWIYPGDTVPDFERAYKSLKPMEVSQPIKTSFGWHLIQVLERRTTDVSTDRKQFAVRKVLRERKSDEAYQEWLRQLRDRAYVEYRLEDR